MSNESAPAPAPAPAPAAAAATAAAAAVAGLPVLQSAETGSFEDLLLRLKQNDPNTAEVKIPSNVHRGYGRALGEALLRNTMVTKLDLNMHYFMSDQWEETAAPPEMQPLQEYVLNNKTLTHFGMDVYRGLSQSYQGPAKILLESVSTCHNMQSLKWGLPICSAAFYSVLTNSNSSLQDLDVSFTVSTALFDAGYVPQIEAAFRGNKTLQKLVLFVVAHPPLYTCIFRGLQESPNPSLRELYLSSTNLECLDVLSQYLRSTRTLERLELEHFSVDHTRMEQLLSALECDVDYGSGSGMVPTFWLKSLSFRNCHIPRNTLFSFLSARAIGANGEIVYRSNLHHLHISLPLDDSTGGRNWSRGELEYQLSFDLADSLLMLQYERAPTIDTTGNDNAADNSVFTESIVTLPAVGSQLPGVSLGSVHPIFFDHLRENVARSSCHLDCMELINVTQMACRAFAQCAPYLTSLHTLKVSSVQPGGCRYLANGIRHSSSICHFTSDLDDAHVVRKIEAYCQRNRLVGTLVASVQPQKTRTGSRMENDGRDNDGANHGTADTDGCTASRTSTLAAAPTTADPRLRPALLQATAPMPPAKRLTMVLRGTMALGRGSGNMPSPKPS